MMLMPEAVPAMVAVTSGPSSGLHSSSSGDYGYYGGYNSGGYYGGYGSGGYGPTDAAAAQQLHGATVAPADESSFSPDGSRATSRSLISMGSQSPAGPSFLRPTTCPPCPACSTATSSESHSLFLRHRGGAPAAAGACYCRYESNGAGWALQEASCRAALYSRCGSQGSLLECATLEAFYSSDGDRARSHRASDQIAAFLFVDCPPAPPCSCAALTSDNAGNQIIVASKAQCCSDLRAHCKVPFSGLDCDEVDAYCSASAATRSAGASDALRQFVAVKTHKEDCAAPQNARAYARFAASNAAAAAAAEALAPVAAAAEMLQQLAGAHGMGGGALAVMVGAAAVAVGAAVAGTVALVQNVVARRYQGTPLLSDY